MRVTHPIFMNLFQNNQLAQSLGIEYPIICAPMFLISNVDMVVAASEAGGIGTFPTLNYRTHAELEQALIQIRQRTSKPIGANLIVNQANKRQLPDLETLLKHQVKLIITSLGNPKDVIAQAHQVGTKVFCDVTNLEHAKKVQDMGADGVIAVGSGAGGHAGPISPLVLTPWLEKSLSIPVVAAGGISEGRQIAASLILGASGVSMGTRFIASLESPASQDYKQAILKATPEDILLTSQISGTPAAVIRTPYTEKMGEQLNVISRMLKANSYTKKWIVPLIHYLGTKKLEQAALTPTWKTVWSAGQSVGLIHQIQSVGEIYAELIKETNMSLDRAGQRHE